MADLGSQIGTKYYSNFGGTGKSALVAMTPKNVLVMGWARLCVVMFEFDCKGQSRVRNDNNVNDQVTRNFTTDVDSIEPT